VRTFVYRDKWGFTENHKSAGFSFLDFKVGANTSSTKPLGILIEYALNKRQSVSASSLVFQTAAFSGRELNQKSVRSDPDSSDGFQ
jgi:hypothetical protein